VNIGEVLGIGGAGLAAGCINAMVGSGTMITFPTLLAFGYPPVLANVSNNVGLIPASLGAAYGYRRELRGQGPRLARFGAASAIGGLVGALSLLAVPSSVFKDIVPVLIIVACGLVVAQPWLSRWVQRRHDDATGGGGVPLWLATLGTGVYGGYFGAAQGVLMMALFGVFLPDDMQRLNAMKNVLTAVVNGVAAVVFIAVTQISWPVAGLIATGSLVGGVLGARVGRRLPAAALRAVIVVVGVTAVVVLLARG
jgi:uncharacterized membrane protein YfcA